MAEQVVSSYNLFVDSSHAVQSGNKGDDFHVNLQDSGVHASDGQVIRVKLENFSMHKNFFDVNLSNKSMVMSFFDSSNVLTHSNVVHLTEQNIDKISTLAADFQEVTRAEIQTRTGQTATISTVSPTATDPAHPSIISFEINCTHNLRQGTGSNSGLIIQFDETLDTYALLGGDRNIPKSPTFSSVDVDTSDANKIVVTCRYPAQRSTTPFVYIRTPGLSSGNIETRSMSGTVASNSENNSNHSYILGRAMVDLEYVQYTAANDREFFTDLQQKSLNHIEIRLTDAKNRPIGRTGTHANNQTAAGTGTSQSTLGNLEFTAVLRIDIVQKRNVNHLDAPRQEPNVPARFSTILQKQAFGEAQFKP